MAFVTAEDIEREDREALAALTSVQQEALARRSMAFRLTHFRGGDVPFNLQFLYEREAQARNSDAREIPAFVEPQEIAA